MKSIEEMVEVMQAFKEGGTIECSEDGKSWSVLTNPNWNWGGYDYRIKEEPESVLMTERQLSELLAKGYGVVAQSPNDGCFVTAVPTYKYPIPEEDSPVDGSLMIRPWGSDDWIRPTVDVYESFVKKEDGICVSK